MISYLVCKTKYVKYFDKIKLVVININKNEKVKHMKKLWKTEGRWANHIAFL
jgi:hypothetical protein